ncbi:selenoprotein W-related protein [Natronincola peptidivorans]|uniref:Selenoprotein W-related protein n=2 Tax=Natronincola peptidivorans TaxID=426128 RepID=A0A1I0C8N9_9FIRM|nr:selenoprotein W-related protein [Natronincola peptidivorans]
MVEKILSAYKNEVTALTLIPSSGGVFEVTSNDQLIFSKKEEGRFPEFKELTPKI